MGSCDEKAFNFFAEQSTEGTPLQSYLFRERDRRFQYATFATREGENVYSTAIPQPIFNATIANLLETQQLDLETVKATGAAYVHEIYTPRTTPRRFSQRLRTCVLLHQCLMQPAFHR